MRADVGNEFFNPFIDPRCLRECATAKSIPQNTTMSRDESPPERIQPNRSIARSRRAIEEVSDDL